MNKNITIGVFSNIKKTDWIVDHWEFIQKEKADARLFESCQWVLNYWKYRFKDVKELTLLIGKTRGGKVVGIFPIAKNSVFLVPFLSTWKCVHSTGEYESNWICHPEYSGEFASAVFDYLNKNRRHWYQVVLDTVWEGSTTLDAIRSECEQRGFPFYFAPGREIPFISTNGDVSAIGELLNGKYRRELKRRQKKLEEINPLRFELYNNQVGLDEALDEFFTVEASGWKGRCSGAILKNPFAEQFWSILANDAAERRQIRLNLLRLGGDVIAGQLGIVFGRTYYCLKVGYDEKYRQFGPGALTTRRAIQQCIEDPSVDAYDFAGTAMPYMQNWTTQTYKTWTIHIGSPHVALGGVFNLIQYGRRTLRPMWRAIKSMNTKKWKVSLQHKLKGNKVLN